MTKNPKISYITSCYNSEEYLDGLIENLLDQDEKDFELIIVDSASTDNSVAVVEKWQGRDSRIKLVRQPKRTPYGVSWLDGWVIAEGSVVGNSNTDDRSYQWRGTKVCEAALNNSTNTPRFYYGGYETRVNGIPTAKGLPPTYSVDDMARFFRCGVHVHWDNNIDIICDLNWDSMYKAAYEYKSAFDYWLVLYFMANGAKGVSIPICFSIYNQRSDSLEQGDKERNTFESLRAIETFFPNSRAILDLENKTRVDSPDFYDRYREFVCKFDV